MATERDFITPNGMFISTTANVVGNTTFVELYGDTIISNTGPSLFINFTKGVMDPRIRWTRGSTATYVDKDDIIRTANVNEPRFQYSNGACQGLLVEEQKTNIWCNENFDYNRSNVTAGTSIGPDNKAAYFYRIPRGVYHDYGGWGSGGGSLIANNTLGAITDFTFTGYFGPSVGNIPLRSDIVFAVANSSGGVSYGEALFNGDTGTFDYTYATAPFSTVNGPTATRHANGMWKVRWTVRVTADSSLKNIVTTGGQIRSGGGTTGFIGDGVSGVQFCCCQVEIGSEPSSYIPTGSSAVTRQADIGVIEGENFRQFYTPTGTLYVHADQYANTFGRGLVTVSNGSANSVSFHIFISSSGGGTILGETNANGVFVSQQLTSYTSGPVFKVAQTLTSNTIAANNSLHYNGTLAGTNSFGLPELNSLQNVDRMIIGDSRFGNGDGVISGIFNGIIKTIAFYPTALTSNQATTLTTL